MLSLIASSAQYNPRLLRIDSDEERLRVFASLSAVDYESKHRKLQRLRHQGTGTWVFQHPAYLAWEQSITSAGLVCHGIRMCVLIITLILHDMMTLTTCFLKPDRERVYSRKLFNYQCCFVLLTLSGQGR